MRGRDCIYSFKYEQFIFQLNLFSYLFIHIMDEQFIFIWLNLNTYLFSYGQYGLLYLLVHSYIALLINLFLNLFSSGRL